VRPVVVRRGDDLASVPLDGLVLCRDLRGGTAGASFAKGRVLRREDAPALLALPWEELHLLAMDAGDVHEDDAGARLAAAAAGDGCEVGRAGGGHWPIAATHRGILDVDADALRRANAVEGICIYTHYAGRIVERGEVVARAKITPFAIAEPVLAAAEGVVREAGGAARVRPFRPTRVGAVVQETIAGRAAERFRASLAEKVEWFGSELLEPRFVEPGEAAIATALDGLVRQQGAEVLVLAGSKAMDVLDPAFGALARLGATVERHGVPAHPGSLFWLARHLDTPILGMPSCGLFSQATVFDLVLPRLLAGERVGPAQLADLGHGGLLSKEMAFRFPPYRGERERGEVGE
jgi:hypothetical protein